MGNTTGRGGRERHDSGDPFSPTKDFSFDFKSMKDDGLPQLDNSLTKDDFKRPRTSTVTKSSEFSCNALPVVFRWENGGKQVMVGGSFNQWKTKIPLSQSHGDFTAIIELAEGVHEYKFYVDGQWVHDPKAELVPNEFGSVNNTVTVKRQDFEVFEALAMDSINTAGTPKSAQDLSSSPPGDYTQDIPSRRAHDRLSGPPILPPHLLQVILNKDVALQYEPGLLPEPNHVMLNHLYALSIKDGVMVLSATHRYRQKYVTTLLYKPI